MVVCVQERGEEVRHNRRHRREGVRRKTPVVEVCESEGVVEGVELKAGVGGLGAEEVEDVGVREGGEGENLAEEGGGDGGRGGRGGGGRSRLEGDCLRADEDRGEEEGRSSAVAVPFVFSTGPSDRRLRTPTELRRGGGTARRTFCVGKVQLDGYCPELTGRERC